MNFKVSILLLAFLAFAACQSPSRLRGATPLGLEDDHILQSIEEFYNGYFSFFQLPSPTQIINCYSKIDVLIFYTSMIELDGLLDDINNRNSLVAHIRILELLLLSLPQTKVARCIEETQDYQSLLKALGIDTGDIDKYRQGESLYIQAHFAQMRENYNPVIGSILEANYKAAGVANGFLSKTIIDTIHNEGFGYLYMASFSNGVAMTVDVTDPQDSLTVWNHTTGGIAMKFLHELAKAVTAGKWNESFDNMVKFWNEKGEEILGEIPLSVWECLDGSKDNKAMTEKLGINVMSKDFEDLAGQYVQQNQLKYYMVMHGIKFAIEHLDFLHAGTMYGAFLRAVAESKPQQTKIISS